MCIKDLSEARELHWRAEKRRRTKSVTGWEGAFKFFTHSHITRTLNFCHVSTLFSFPFDDIISSSFSPGEIKFLQMNCANNCDTKEKKKKPGSTLPPDDAVFSAFILLPFAVVSLKWMRGPLVLFFLIFFYYTVLLSDRNTAKGGI